MQHVIIDRPRYHSGWGSKMKGKVKAWHKAIKNDDHPKREKMSIGWGDKELNENLMPLFRFLEGKVGKFWDKVYSEIRENINPKNATQLHILQHLEHYVEKNAIEVSKGVFRDSRGESIGDPFFVHPKTGCLMKNDESHYFRKYHWDKKKDEKFRRIDDRTYMEINGVWYEVGLVALPKQNLNKPWYLRDGLSDPLCFDMVQRSHIRYDEARKLYGGLYYATMKRQLNHREIAKLGLREEAA